VSERLDGPADTRILGIVHSALRRDLERSRIVLAAGGVPDARRAVLAEHLGWLMDFLHDRGARNQPPLRGSWPRSRGSTPFSVPTSSTRRRR
jgi:hypothetical protein